MPNSVESGQLELAPALEPAKNNDQSSSSGGGAISPALLRRKLARRLARRADGNGVEPGAEHAVGRAGESSGEALPSGVQSKFESSLGADLSGVRLHTGAASSAAAESVGARAYTTGNDIHFGAGQYNPSSREGQHLLAHEVAHTVQQSSGNAPGGSTQYKLEVSSPEDSQEHEADHAADAMVDGRTASGLSMGSGVARKIQRVCADGAVSGGTLLAGPPASAPAPGAAPAAGAAAGKTTAPATGATAAPATGATAAHAPGGAASPAGGATAAPTTGATAGPTAAVSTAATPPRLDPPGSGAAGPLSEDRALAVLTARFQGFKTISKGTVRLLEQAPFQAAYDAVYGTTQYSWALYVVPRFGNLNGFAHDNVNYINKATANTGTVPHEMLHNNAAADWRPFVGNQFDEGSTDYLKQAALRLAGLSSPNSYEAQLGVVRACLDTGISDDQFFTAYLVGGAATIIGAWVDRKCVGTWEEVKAASQAQDYTRAKVKLARKPAEGNDFGDPATPRPTGGTAMA